jgi:hypothetical protein
MENLDQLLIFFFVIFGFIVSLAASGLVVWISYKTYRLYEELKKPLPERKCVREILKEKDYV